MESLTTHKLLDLAIGECVTRKAMYELVQRSKIEGSPCWSGPSYVIGNTPQQGINWVGPPPAVRAVIIKTRAGAYAEDGWIDAAATRFRYSYKARRGSINLRDTANTVLMQQPQFGYPILLFIAQGVSLRLAGHFETAALEERSIVLRRTTNGTAERASSQDDVLYPEGNRRFVTHLVAERSRAAIAAVKQCRDWVCEICGENYEQKYGVPYIEAHHKLPLENFDDEHNVRASDLALLCPSCHKAVHIHMRLGEADFIKLCSKLQGMLSKQQLRTPAS